MASEFVLEGTEQNFASEVEQSKTPVLVDFWAPWCGPCLSIAPTIDELAAENQGKLKIVKVNVDENPGLGGKFGIRGIPTLLFFKDGQIVRQLTGAQPKKRLQEAIDELT